MSSYASVASLPLPSVPSGTVPTPDSPVATATDSEIAGWLQLMSQVTDAPDGLVRLVENLRCEMELPTGSAGFRSGCGGAAAASASHAHAHAQAPTRNFNTKPAPTNAWRGRFNGTATPFDTRNTPSAMRQSTTSEWVAGTSSHGRGTPDGWTKPTSSPAAQQQSSQPRPPVGRYQSRFKATGNIEDKILNTVIGNKLNAFTPLTYNDTRDFIYQIMDSGEKEFVKDFIEKVFMKATLEDLYCALFAKLIAEIAHRYPVIYEEMDKYHGKFLEIFDNVTEDSEADYAVLIKQKQYRMGYGQFIAELAGLNALEKKQLITMVVKIMDKLWSLSAEQNKTKTVEEFIDCLTRLTGGLRERSPAFFRSVKGDIIEIMKEKVNALIARSEPRPSLSKKAGFGLMDLKEILGA